MFPGNKIKHAVDRWAHERDEAKEWAKLMKEFALTREEEERLYRPRSFDLPEKSCRMIEIPILDDKDDTDYFDERPLYPDYRTEVFYDPNGPKYDEEEEELERFYKEFNGDLEAILKAAKNTAEPLITSADSSIASTETESSIDDDESYYGSETSDDEDPESETSSISFIDYYEYKRFNASFATKYGDASDEDDSELDFDSFEELVVEIEIDLEPRAWSYF